MVLLLILFTLGFLVTFTSTKHWASLSWFPTPSRQFPKANISISDFLDPFLMLVIIELLRIYEIIKTIFMLTNIVISKIRWTLNYQMRLHHYKVGFLSFPSPSLPFSSPPPSCQSNFLILNISAKSSRIFIKFSEKLPVGVSQWLKQKNKSINKQTNKNFQSNFLILNISAISSWVFKQFWGELFVGVQLWWKKQTNILTNKQKNKQINMFWVRNISAKSSQIFSKF